MTNITKGSVLFGNEGLINTPLGLTLPIIGVFWRTSYDIMSVIHGVILLHGSSGVTSTPRRVSISKQTYNLGLIPSLGTVAIPPLCERG